MRDAKAQTMGKESQRLNMEAYLDNAATTQCASEVADTVVKLMREDYGNPSSKHKKGLEAENYIKHAAQTVAKSLKCQDKEILFTSGGTESNNLAIIGAAAANKRRGNHIITSSVEHASVKEPFRYLEEQGYRVSYLPVDKNGVVSLEALKQELCEETILVSVMWVNNEIGTIEPVEEIGRIVKAYHPEIVYHVDAIQAYGKLRTIPKKANIDLLSVSGHKIHGPKGVGFLYIKEKTKIKPILFGGGQQKAMRSGTENVPGIAGLGTAVELIYGKDYEENVETLYALREYFIGRLLTLDGVQLNGFRGREAAPHIVSASFAGLDKAEVLLHALEERGIYVSSGSACSSNKPGISSTLEAIQVDQALLNAVIRFSFHFHTVKQELDYTIDTLAELLPKLRKYTRR